MVQKSQTTTWDGAKTRRKEWDNLPTPTGAGFPNHQQYHSPRNHQKTSNKAQLQKRYFLPTGFLPAKSSQEVAEEEENDGLSYAPWMAMFFVWQQKCKNHWPVIPSMPVGVAKTLGTKCR